MPSLTPAVVRGLTAAAVLAAALATGCDTAESLFFHPDAVVYGTPAGDGLAYEAVSFASEDGTPLSGWFIPAVGEPTATVVHFHGNAQNMTAHYAFVSWLPRQGLNVFVFDYRGYGASAGTPTPRGVMADSVAALNHVRARRDLGPRKIAVFGQSLGGANALAALGVAGCEDVVGVVIDSAFSSYTAVARDKAPLLAGLLIRDEPRPLDALASIAPVPILLVHGTADAVVPFRHANILLEAASEPKELWVVPGGNHLDAFGARFHEYGPKLLARLRAWAAAPEPVR
jgi:hypothetical protein